MNTILENDVTSEDDEDSENDEIINEVKKLIKIKCSPRHVPSVVLQVNDIPYTINGKKVEVDLYETKSFVVALSCLNMVKRSD